MADSDSPTVTWAEFKQKWRWSNLLASVWIVLFFLSLHELRAPGISPAARLIWCLVPFPPGVVGFWMMVRDTRRHTEMERQVTGEAMGYAFYLTVAYYAGMGLVNVAYPFDPQTWATSFIFPLLAYMVCWAIVYRRVNPR